MINSTIDIPHNDYSLIEDYNQARNPQNANHTERRGRYNTTDTNDDLENQMQGHNLLRSRKDKPKFLYKLFSLLIVILFLVIFNNYFNSITKQIKNLNSKIINDKEYNTDDSNISYDNNNNNNSNITIANDKVCYIDPVFNLFSQANKQYSDHQDQRHSLLITSSLAMDISVYTSFYVYITYAKNWVFLISIAIFYASRQILLSFFTIRFPEGYIFDAPSISSLTVSYSRTNDFFYSGHIGIALIIFQLFRELKMNKFLSLLFILVASLEAYTMIVLRGHYFIDILYGAIMSFYSYRKAYKVESWLKKYWGLKIEENESDNENERNKAIARKYLVNNNIYNY